MLSKEVVGNYSMRGRVNMDFKEKVVALQAESKKRHPLPAIEEVQSLTNNRYIPISKAGSGAAAVVYFCIEKPSQNSRAQPDSTRSLTRHIKPNVYAVKLPRQNRAGPSHWETLITKEMMVLTRIPLEAGKLAHRFVQSVEGSAGRFLATLAIPGFEMMQLVHIALSKINPLPLTEEFVLHIFVQFSEAVQCLHGMKPPVVHGDLSFRNTLLDPSRPVLKLPSVVLIDFGIGEWADYDERKLVQDLEEFYVMMGKLISYTARREDRRRSMDSTMRIGGRFQSPPRIMNFQEQTGDDILEDPDSLENDPEWVLFCDLLAGPDRKDKMRSSFGQPYPPITKFRDRFLAMAERRLWTRTAEQRRDTIKIVDRATEEGCRMPSEEDIEAILQRSELAELAERDEAMPIHQHLKASPIVE